MLFRKGEWSYTRTIPPCLSPVPGFGIPIQSVIIVVLTPFQFHEVIHIKNLSKKIKLTLLLLSLTNCLFGPDEEEKQARKSYKLATTMNSYFFLSQNRNVCLERTNIDITEGETLGPFTEEQCFKITATGKTSIKMITPGTTTGFIDVWSSNILPWRQRNPGYDDPTLPIPSRGIWYANVYCSSCTSYSIQIQ